MMISKRIAQLQTVSIPALIKYIFPNGVTYEDVGHHEDLRNYVVKIDNKYILKVYGDRLRWKSEVENLIKIRPSKLCTPHLIDYGMVNLHNGWVLMDLLHGTLMENEYYGFSLNEKVDMWQTLGNLLYQFHTANTVGYRDVTMYELNSSYQETRYWDYVINEYNQHKMRIVNNDFFGCEETYSHAFAQIEKRISTRKNLNQLQLVLCHNDFCIRNILRQSDGFGLIDFEMSHYAPREADFARLAMELKIESLFEHFLCSYYSNLNPMISRDNEMIETHILLKAMEICSWSYNRAYDYYKLAFKTLESIL